MRSKNSLSIVIILTLLLSVLEQTLPLSVFANSPSFVRQQIEDDPLDFLSYDPISNKYGPADSDCTRSFPSPTDIKSVSYISNGTILVATIWLNTPPGMSTRDYQLPKNISVDEQESLKHVTYSMYVDVDSVYESGVDYIMNVYRNNTDRSWAQELIESSSPNAKFFKSARSSFEIGDQFVTMNFDLATINYPEDIKLFFATSSSLIPGNNTDNTCDLVDLTNFAIIPPPQFQLSSSPNPLELRAGEEKTIQLQIKSEANINSYASISADAIDNDIRSDFTSDLLSLLPFGNGSTTLRIRALENASVKSYALPIFVNISFPLFLEPTIGGKIQLGYQVSTVIPKNLDLTVNIIPGPDLKEHLDNLTNWIAPLNSVWTFIAAIGAVIVPLVIRKKQKDQQEKRT
jgi:hypothetical protein